MNKYARAGWLCQWILILTPAMLHAGQHALLVGVSDYIDPRIPDLEGPVNDVRAVRDALIRNWQFDDADITMLIDEQATEASILRALDALGDITEAGDDLIFYFSGHGTSAADPDLGAHIDLPDGSGAIVASDFDPAKLDRGNLLTAAEDGLLIGRIDIRPRLQALDTDRNVLVIFDACFSGNAVREVESDFKPASKRQLDLNAYLLETTAAPKTRSVAVKHDVDFAYRNTVYFGAAAEDQYAVDLSMADIEAGLVTTIDGKPHGGFTDSLLRALNDNTGAPDSLSYIQLFNRTVNHFNVWCKSCGHTPVSLPGVGTSDQSLLGRIILTPSSLFASHTDYDPSSEPTLQEALIVDTQLLDDISLALRRATPISESILDSQGVSHTASPDLYLTQTTNELNAYASDGQLLTQLPIGIPDESLTRWLEGRQWLKRRMSRDLAREYGDLKVAFRQPLSSNRVTEGEYLHFNVLSESAAALVVLLLDANSNLSLLYPINQQERDAVLPVLQSQRIPALNGPQLEVTPPWGTDTVIFYAVPVEHSLEPVLQQLASLTSIPLTHPALRAFEAALERDDFTYSSTTIRVVAVPEP